MREFTLFGLLAYALFAIFFAGCDSKAVTGNVNPLDQSAHDVAQHP